jgi:hypothetical protein
VMMSLVIGRIGMTACMFGLAALLPIPLHAAEGSKACSLVTSSEIEAVIGSSVTLNPSPSLPVGKGEFCLGKWPDGKLMLRLVTGLDPERDRSGSKEKSGLEMMKNMGAQVDVKTFGPIVCSMLVPPSGKEQMGYNTTCTVSKDTAVAGIEVTAKNKTSMIPIEKLHQLAEKMTGRF